MKQQQIIESIKTIIQKRKTSTQTKLVIQLAEMGYETNQSKISRLLRKLNVHKTKNEWGNMVYTLPQIPAPPTSNAQLTELITNIHSNEVMITIQTSPGSASLVARLLDYHQENCKILATLAGDDAILVVPQSVKQLTFTKNAIKKLIT